MAPADATLRADVVPCQPTGADDESCFRAFVTAFGRRALRRTITDEEVDNFATHFLPHAAAENDFWVAVNSGLRAFLYNPPRVPRSRRDWLPVPGVPGMSTDFEVATRLSYLLWGSMPPDWLLDAAEAGELSDPDKLRESAATMLGDARALERISAVPR